MEFNLKVNGECLDPVESNEFLNEDHVNWEG